MCTALPRPSHHCIACHCIHSMPRCCAKWGRWGPSCLGLIYPCNWPRCHQQRFSACNAVGWVWPEGECRYWRGLGTEEIPEEVQCWWESSQSTMSNASSCIFWCWVQTWPTRHRRLRCQAAAWDQPRWVARRGCRHLPSQVRPTRVCPFPQSSPRCLLPLWLDWSRSLCEGGRHSYLVGGHIQYGGWIFWLLYFPWFCQSHSAPQWSCDP